MEPGRPGIQPGRRIASWRNCVDYPEENRAYFVTAIVKERKTIFNDHDVASQLRDVIDECRARYGFLVLGYAIMPDHLHALIVPGSRNTVSDIMRYIKGSFARWYNQARGKSGAVWQPRFYDVAIRSERELMMRIQYVEDNPVRAGMVEAADRYEFSSAAVDWRSDLERYYEH